MSKTHKRPPIKQHKDLLEDDRYSSRVEGNKKKENKTKYPKKDLYDACDDLSDWSIHDGE